jgi:hypothetical protein
MLSLLITGWLQGLQEGDALDEPSLGFLSYLVRQPSHQPTFINKEENEKANNSGYQYFPIH